MCQSLSRIARTSCSGISLCLGVIGLSAHSGWAQQSELASADITTQPTTLPAGAPLPPDRLFALASPGVATVTIKDEDSRVVGTASAFVVGIERKVFEFGGQEHTWPVTSYRVTLVTNYHVIRPAVSIGLRFSNEQGAPKQKSEIDDLLANLRRLDERSVEVIAESQSADVAVLLARSSDRPARVLRLHTGANLPIGTKVYAIGSPQGLTNTLSEGLISGYRNRGAQAPWIQTTAPISPGSSGGPLLSDEGLVLGVTTAFLAEGQNLNFVVPASEILRLLNGPKKSRMIWEGASIRVPEDLAFFRADGKLRRDCWKEHSDDIPDGQFSEVFEQFCETRLSEGDQLALLVKGRDSFSSGEYREAVRTLRRATAAKAGEYAYLAYYALGQAIWEAARERDSQLSVEDAIEVWTKAKKVNPEFAPTRYRLGYAYRMLFKDPEALIEAEALIRLTPRCYRGYQMRGAAWAALGRTEAFERDFDTALELRPNDAALYREKAEGYASLGNWEKTAETCQAAIALDERDFLAHYRLGDACQRLGEYEKAITAYERALTLTEPNGGIGARIQQAIAECRRRMLVLP